MSTCFPAESVVRPSSMLTERTPSAPPDRDSLHVVPSTGSACLSADRYRVALLSMDTRKAPSSTTTYNAEVAHVLVLPVTWDDLLDQIRVHTEPLQTAHCNEIEQFGNIRIDFLRHETRRNDQPVDLTAFEFKVVKFFLSNPYRVISRSELLQTVWGYHCYPSTRTVDNKILRLRQKLETEPAKPIHFQTVHGVGYKFVP